MTLKGRRRARTAGAATVLASLLLAGCGGGSPVRHTAAAHSAAAHAPATYAGPTVQNPAPEPPLRLRDHLGRQVDLRSFLGRPVLLTFIYTHCPDVCPLIVSNLHNALALLGPGAAKVQIIGVSTDPKGDTPTAVASFLARREMSGRMEYLIGTRSELIPVWRAWGISVTDPTSHDEVAHSALVYGITASGRITTLYPSNFTPTDIAHDVPLLAAS